MRAVFYEVTLYPKDSVSPEVRSMKLMDMHANQPAVPCKPQRCRRRKIFVHIDPKVQPITGLDPTGAK